MASDKTAQQIAQTVSEEAKSGTTETSVEAEKLSGLEVRTSVHAGRTHVKLGGGPSWGGLVW